MLLIGNGQLITRDPDFPYLKDGAVVTDGEVIKAWATEGHSVTLPGLGTMRFGLSAKSVADVNEVKSSRLWELWQI